MLNDTKQHQTILYKPNRQAQWNTTTFFLIHQCWTIFYDSVMFYVLPCHSMIQSWASLCGNCEALEQTCDRRETKRNIWWRNGKAQVGIQSFASYSYVPSHAFSYGDPTLGSLKVGCGPLHWSGRRSLQATPPCRRGTFLIFLSRQTRKEYDSIWEYLLNDIDSWKDS